MTVRQLKRTARLRTTLLFNFVLVAIFPIIIIGFISLNNFTNSMRYEITNKNFLLARSLTGEVERFLEEPLNILIRIEDIIFERGMIGEAQVNEYLDSIVANSEIYDMIQIVDQSGIVKYLAPFNRDILDVSISGHDYYRIVKEINSPYWSQTFISPQTGRPTLTLSMPSKYGMIIGHLNLAALNSIIENVNIGSDAYAAVTDNNGITIGHLNETFVSERFSLHSLEPITSGMSGREGTFLYEFSGLKYLGSVSIVEHTHWIVLVAQSEETAFAPLLRVRNFIFAGIIFSIVLALTVAVIILKRTLRPLSQLSNETKRIADGDYNFILHPAGYSEFNELLHSFTVMVNAIKNRTDEMLKVQKELYVSKLNQSRAEYKILQNQINPHFLYNTLESIKMTAVVYDQDEIADALTQLGDLFRYSIRESEDYVAVKDEVNHAKTYLSLIKIRYQEKLELEFDVDEKLLEKKVIKFILQPLLENAVVHGIARKAGPGKIKLGLEKKGDNLVFSIDDDGCGASESDLAEIIEKINTREEIYSDSIGMANVNQRIKMLCGDNFGLTVTGTPGEGFSVKIIVPENRNRGNQRNVECINR